MYDAILTRLPVKSRLSLLPNDILYISESIYYISFIKGFLRFSSNYNSCTYLLNPNSF